MSGLRIDLVDCDQACWVAADAEKARQILLNLLSNAMKFTPRGGQVTIRCASRSEFAEITVADSGIGIPTEKLESIFEPFVQVDTRLTRTQDGVGLGLAISRDLARGMGGDLVVASRLGEGATFTLRLPFHPDHALAPLAESSSHG